MSGGNLNVLFAPIWDSRSLDGHEHKMCFRILDSDISLFELQDDRGLYFGCQMPSLFENVLFGTISWQTWAQYFVSPPPSSRLFKIALPNLCRLFPPAGFGQKKTPGAFIALESLSTAAISLSLLLGWQGWGAQMSLIERVAQMAKVFFQCERKYANVYPWPMTKG